MCMQLYAKVWAFKSAHGLGARGLFKQLTEDLKLEIIESSKAREDNVSTSCL